VLLARWRKLPVILEINDSATVERVRPSGGDGTTLFDQYLFTAVAPETGVTLSSSRIGQGVFADTLQMAGNIGLGRVFWQGTVGGVVRVAPR